MKHHDLSRFIKAQNRDFYIALEEIKCGRKEGHWMWYIFPQLVGLGSSFVSNYYGINDMEEAKAFLANSFLRKNLLEICDALLSLETNDPLQILDYPDNLKLCSSMTLFAATEPSYPVFQQVLDKFFEGKKDKKTLELLS